MQSHGCAYNSAKPSSIYTERKDLHKREKRFKFGVKVMTISTLRDDYQH